MVSVGRAKNCSLFYYLTKKHSTLTAIISALCGIVVKVEWTEIVRPDFALGISTVRPRNRP